MQRKADDSADTVEISVASVKIPFSPWNYKIPTLSQGVRVHLVVDLRPTSVLTDRS
jgi:hypothetical protein